MKLSTEQVKEIEKYITSKNFDYVDLKHEVLDHMISDVEEKMKRSISFEVALESTIQKWNRHFKESFSLYFGIQFSRPKIMIKNATKLFKKYFFLYLTMYFLPMLILQFIEVKVDENIAYFLNDFFKVISIACACYFLFIILKVKRLKKKTTYSFLLKTQYSAIFFFLLVAFTGVFNRDNTLNPVTSGFAFAGYFVIVVCSQFFKKHKEVIAKYDLN